MGLRGRLLLLVLLPAIPGLFLAIYASLGQRQIGRARVEKDAVRVVQLAAAQQTTLIDNTRQHLLALSRFGEARGTNYPAYDKFLRGFRGAYPDYLDFGLLGTNGQVLACSRTERRPTNVADRAFFQRVLKTRDFAAGTYEAGMPPTLWFGYPVLDPQGRLVRVVYATLELTALSGLLAKTEIPPGAVVQVLDTSGQVVARFPDAEHWLGKPLGDPTLLPVIQSRKEGTAEMRVPEDVARLSAFTALGAGPHPQLYASVGIPLSLAYAETRRMLFINLVVLGIVAAAALAGAWICANRYILRPVNTLTETTHQVALGNLEARTGLEGSPGELHRLACAFDQMAESLQRQRFQNEQLNARLEDRVKERTAQLELSNQELESFSYSVSHDLRAPLRHIHGYVQQLQEHAGAALDPQSVRLLTSIANATKRMGVLIDDLLAFSRMGRIDVSKTVVQTDDVVREVIQELKRDTEGREIRWTIEPLPTVEADRALMKQVWTNLISNAVKYTRHRPNAEIQIGSRQNGHELQFQVRDNGAGFDMRYAHKLFRVFERLHRSEEFEGTGIGLANVRRIIHRHGGRTWAEGAPGQGATFYFTLPTA